MRTKPFDIEPEVTAPEPKAPVRISLAERLSQKPFKQTETKEPEGKPETTTEDQNKSESAEEPSGAFEDGKKETEFEDLEKQVEQMSDSDAQEIAELIIELINGGRIMFMPSIYEGLAFPGQERNDVHQVMNKVRENEKQNKQPDEGLSNYEKRLYAKWPKVRQDIENVSYTDDERKGWAKHLAKKVKDKGAARFIYENMWMLYPIFLEIKHGRNVMSSRAGEWFKKKK